MIALLAVVMVAAFFMAGGILWIMWRHPNAEYEPILVAIAVFDKMMREKAEAARRLTPPKSGPIDLDP